MEKQKTYGFLNNFIYALNIERKSNLRLLAITLIKPIGDIVGTLLNSYAPKYVLSFIENDLPLKTIIIYTIVICLIMLIFDIISTSCYNSFEFEYRKTEGYVEKKRMDKLFHTDFKNMESPDFLDYVQRAKTAVTRGSGFHGVVYESRNFIAQGTLMILSAVLIGIQNLLMMVCFIIISFGTAKILTYFTKLDKEKFSDAMAPTWRKMTYLESTTKNFDFAKDIRLFNMSNIFQRKLDDVNNVYNVKNKEHHNRWIVCNVDMELILLIQKVLMYTWLVYNVVTGAYQISDFVLYVGLVTTFHNSVGYVNWIYSSIRGNCLMINDYRNFIDWKEDKETADEKDGYITDINLNRFEFRFENVSFKYPGHDNYVLKNVNLTIKDGTKLAVVGVNGAGKTTSFYMTVGLITPNEGRIFLDDLEITKYPVYKRAQTGIGYLAQEASVFRQMTVEDNIASVLEMTNKPLDYQKDKLESLIAEFRLQKVRKNKGTQLSGGERRRTEIARCLAIDPKFIMLDEPFAGVDPIAVEDIQQIVWKLKDKNIGILITDHNVQETLSITDRAYLLFEGKILFQGTPEELAENKIVREKYLSNSFVLRRKDFQLKD